MIDSSTRPPAILVAEDDPASARLLERVLLMRGYRPTICANGEQALHALRADRYDALLTDWMMPRMDGVTLIRQVRAELSPPPLIIMITALASEESRAHALDAGADDYLTKPYNPAEVLARLDAALARMAQPAPPRPPIATPPPPAARPPYVAVCIATSTGGPAALVEALAPLDPGPRAVLFVVQHAPGWMLESFVSRLAAHLPLEVVLGRDGMQPAPGQLVLAPGDRHLLVEGTPPRLRLDDGTPENFVKPAADPLFRSAAAVFGRACVGVVLTGMGRDGALGAAAIARAGGVILAQDPASATAPSMPRSVIDIGLAAEVLPLGGIAGAIQRQVALRSTGLVRLGAAA